MSGAWSSWCVVASVLLAATVSEFVAWTRSPLRPVSTRTAARNRRLALIPRDRWRFR